MRSFIVRYHYRDKMGVGKIGLHRVEAISPAWAVLGLWKMMHYELWQSIANIFSFFQKRSNERNVAVESLIRAHLSLLPIAIERWTVFEIKQRGRDEYVRVSLFPRQPSFRYTWDIC